MLIYKFGGTSQANAARMKAVADIIRTDPRKKIIVLSAVAGTTDQLIMLSSASEQEAGKIIRNFKQQYETYIEELLESEVLRNAAHNFIKELLHELNDACKKAPPRDEKWFVARGELISTYLFSLHMQEKGEDAVLLPALDYMRIEEGEPDLLLTKELLQKLIESVGDHSFYITQGYICRNEKGEIDNLRRGGSDYSATIIGAVLKAEEIQIWTDIDGVHNNDPRVVQKTKRVDELSYAEAAELAYFGAKILHPLCVRPAREAGVPIRLLNTLNPDSEGTIIHRESLSEKGVKAVAAKDGITVINIRSSHMLMAHGFLRKIFEVFENHKTSVDMITTAEVAVSLTIDDDRNLDKIVADLETYGAIAVDRGQSIICVVGAFRKDDSGVAIKVLEPLKHIPIRMISSGGSESNISVLIDSKYKLEALEALNRELFGYR